MTSLRMPEAMYDELVALAAEASEQTGRKVTRAEVHRRITAEGIRRARAAHRYVGRLAGEPTPAGPTARAPDEEGAP